MQLPYDFEKRMKAMLGEEYASFAAALDNSPLWRGIRINPLKDNAEKAIFELIGKPESVPWCQNGYYTDKDIISGKHPYHVGGLVYFQEPSAMSSAEALGIKKGDIVLDLCAAPGGKATQAAEKLGGSGLLVANEIIPKRASVLAENIQRMGITNAVVTNEAPETLAEKYEEFFDKIIVDAPCSGEGMFRKEPHAVSEWSPEHTASCAQRQKKILQSAFKMLKGGGYLIYSTCTFAPEENEGVTQWVLSAYPDIELVPISLTGMSDARGEWAQGSYDMSYAKRIFPHRAKGEGHYAALFHKKYGGENRYFKRYKCDGEGLYREFEREFLNTDLRGDIIGFGDKLYLMPHSLDIDRIKTVQPGLFLGVCKKNRFEPSHALCIALSEKDFAKTVSVSDPKRYFRGETMECAGSGWTAVLYNGYPIGWGKASGGILKNHFPKYLRF